MSSMVIECISRGSDSLRDSVNAKPGSSVEGSSNVDTASSRIPNSTISAFPVSSYQQLEEIGVDSGAETISVVPVGSEATAAAAVPSIRIPLSNNLQPNKAPDRRQPLVNKAGNSVSRSSCKRKPALPRKRPSTMQEPVIISAETGEAVDDVLPTEDSNGSLGNVLYDRNYRSFAVAINNSRGTADETQISFNGPGDLDGVAPATNEGNKPQLTIDSKTSKSSEDMLSQQNGINGSSVQNLNDVLILNAAMNSFLWASAEPSDSTLLKTTTFLSTAAATPVKENSPIRDSHPSALSTIDAVDSKTTMNLIKPPTLKLVPEVMECVDICESSPNYITLKPLVPNSFLPPCETVLPSSETSPLTNPVEVVKEISTNDGILSTDQQQNANMLLLEAAAAATAAGTMQDLIGSLPRNGDVASLDITNNSKCQQPEVPSTSVTAEVITTGTANIVFNGKDGTIRKHDRRLKGRFALNGKATTVGEHVVNMLNLSDTKRRTNKAPKSKIGDTRINVKRRADDATLINAARAITKEEKIDLDELENFAQTFKKQRIKFGFTQGDVGLALGRRYGTDFSQTTISRFEALNLSFKNMCKLRPLLKEWLEDAEAALASGATVSDLLDASSKESVQQRPMPVVHLPLDKPNPAVIANNMCNNSSRIASDGSPSSNGSIVVNAGGNGNGIPLKKRRKRTNLDLAQRSALDAYFDMNPRPDHDRMAEIAGLVGLDRDVVRVWFCNRRQKVRKE